MTNFHDPSFSADEPLIERRVNRKLLKRLPVVVGGVVGLLLFGGWVVPAFQQLQTDQERLNGLEEKERQLPLLRAQLDQTILQQQQADAQELRLLGLIAGSGTIETFMAQVDREAQRHGVKLDELQPSAPPAATGAARPAAGAAGAAAAAGGSAATDCGDLANSGFSARRQSLAASGRYPNLLAFVRALESLSLLVVQCDLALEQPDPEAVTDAKKLPPIPPMQVRFDLSLYEKAKPGQPGKPGQPAAAPPAAQR